MIKLVAADIGGTHARFALAAIAPDGAIALGDVLTLRTGDYPGLPAAWRAFAEHIGRPLPRAAAIAIAASLHGGLIRMTNNDWTVDQPALAAELAVDRLTLVNDFAAVAHAVAHAGGDLLPSLSGPDKPLPATGTVSVIGPGTGLGTASFHRFAGGYHVQDAEGGHIAFGPLDEVEDAILAHLRRRHARVSVERVVSGPGLAAIYETLAEREGRSITPTPDRVLWERGMAGEDVLAAAAIERFCMILGSVAGDFALAHGADAVVIAGGLGLRLRQILPASRFGERFCDKGRYQAYMATLPVRLITHPQPGLYGAAAAFAGEHATIPAQRA